jgi:hypothetical protein
MDELTERQTRFLEDYAFDERTMDALLQDHEVRPRELREWRENPAFVREIETIEDFHTFARECNVRKGAMDYVRRTRHGYNGENRQLSARLARDGWKMFDKARELDKHLLRKRGPKKIIFVNPVHPAYADSAMGLLERLEALQRRAEKARVERKEEVKALPSPGEVQAKS